MLERTVSDTKNQKSIRPKPPSPSRLRYLNSKPQLSIPESSIHYYDSLAFPALVQDHTKGTPPSTVINAEKTNPRKNPENQKTELKKPPTNLTIHTVSLDQQTCIDNDGRSFVKQQPYAVHGRLGMDPSSAEVRAILTDTCSDTSLIDSQLFYLNYPDTPVHTYTRTRLSGIGHKNTQGFAVVPVHLEMTDQDGNALLAKLNVEFHLLSEFGPGALLGSDTLQRYAMVIDLGKQTIHAGPYSTPASTSRAEIAPVAIKSKAVTTVPPWTTKVIAVYADPPVDAETLYAFIPYSFGLPGKGVSVHLPKGVLDRSVHHMTFMNRSPDPINIARHLQLGTAYPLTSPNDAVIPTSLSHDFADQVNPGPCNNSSELRPETTLAPTLQAEPTDDSLSEAEWEEEQLNINPEPLDQAEVPPIHGQTTDDFCKLAVAAVEARTEQKNAGQLQQIADQALRLINPQTTLFVGAEPPQTQEPPRKPLRVAHVEDADSPDAPPLPPDLEPTKDEQFDIWDGLQPEQRATLQEMLDEYHDCFSSSKIGTVKDYVAYIPTGANTLPQPQPLRPANPAKQKIIEETLNQYLEMDLI